MKKIKNILPGGKNKKAQSDDVTKEEVVVQSPAKAIDTQDAAVVDAHMKHGNVLSHPADGTTVVAAVLKDKTAAPFTDKAGVAAEDKHQRPHLPHLFGHKHKHEEAASPSAAPPVLRGGPNTVGAAVPLKQDFTAGMGQSTVVTPGSGGTGTVPTAVNQMHDESELALKHAEEAARAARGKIDEAAEAAKRKARSEGGVPTVAFAPGTAAGDTASPAVVETITTTTTATIGGGGSTVATPAGTLQVVKEAAVAGVEKTRSEAATGLQQAQEALVAGRDMLISATNTGLEKVKENVAWAAEKAKENAAWGAGKTQEAAVASRDGVVDTSTPIIEQAKQSAIATKDAVVENGAPVVERAKENTAWGLEKVKENAAWAAEKAREDAAWAAQKAQEAYSAGKGLVQEALAPPPHESAPQPEADGYFEPPQREVVDAAPRGTIAPQQAVQEVIVPVQTVYVEQPPLYVEHAPVYIAPVVAAQAVDAGAADRSTEVEAQSQQPSTAAGLYNKTAMDAVNQALAAGRHTAEEATASSGLVGKVPHPPAQHGV